MHQRRATTVFECLLAILVMGVAVAGVSQLSVAIARQQRGARQHAVALQQAANMLERLLAEPAGSTLAEDARELPGELREVLPGGATDVLLEPLEDGSAGERVVVQVHWNDPFGGSRRQVQLAGWRFRRVEAGP